MSDATGLAEAMLGLDGFVVLGVREDPAELVITIETTADVVGCGSCGVRAQAHDRMPIQIRDLACFGRPTRLVWRKRRWRCREELCPVRTWTEMNPAVLARQLITWRAGLEACRQVGELARPVSTVAAEFGVCWWTVMNAVIDHGTRLVDHPDRVGPVTQLGVDETSFLAANRDHHTMYVSGLVDLSRHTMIDMFPGNSARDLRKWTSKADKAWLAGVEVVATDLTESYRSGLTPHLAHVTRVADPFHVVRVANRCLDKIRRRVQNETLGHRGRRDDPLFKIRKIMLTGAERLDDRGRERMLLGLRVGDPNDEVLGGWLAKESVRDLYLTAISDEAELLLDKVIAGCADDDVAEIRSLGKTLARWRPEILAYHDTRASNGPSEGLNLCVKKVKRCGHGFRRFEHYRLRVLLHTGGIDWPARPRPPRIRSRCSPHSNA
ncbi:MAG: ISL3 family transposase [Acidimicrobiia bacterium]|nr:ISL3 family transposase [Acidimicrobiia bacterium]